MEKSICFFVATDCGKPLSIPLDFLTSDVKRYPFVISRYPIVYILLGINNGNIPKELLDHRLKGVSLNLNKYKNLFKGNC